MKLLRSSSLSVCLDERFPRVVRYQSPDGRRSIPGERKAQSPRLYVYRIPGRQTFTSDDPEIEVSYTLTAGDDKALYHGRVMFQGQVASEFDVAFELAGADLVVRLQNVREHGDNRFLTFRMDHLVSATSRDPDNLLVTCGWQGRILDPKKCKPLLVDFSWVGFTARMCGAAYRPDMMVTLDLPGYEDLMIQEVWQYSRIGDAETFSSLGAEMMYRQRKIEGDRKYNFVAEGKMPKEILRDEPILCADSKEVRMHAVFPAADAELDWTDAAKYFQSLLPADIVAEPRYENTLIYKIRLALRQKPALSVGQAEAIIRKIQNLTDGVKQVCYLAFFQYKGGENGFPEMFKVYPAVGTKEDICQLIKEAPQYNATVSFHQNLNVFEHGSECFDGEYCLRTFDGRLLCCWDIGDCELFSISMPAYRDKAMAILRRVFKEYGITGTYHLDTFNGAPYLYDAHPTRPFNATKFVQVQRQMADEIRKTTGVDLTSETLMDAYLGHVGHSWTLFDHPSIWEGEKRVPLTPFIYHGAASWNNIRPIDDKSFLEGLISGSGMVLEFPMNEFFPELGTDESRIIDGLHLLQVPYYLLRGRKWTGYREHGSLRRVDYSPAPLGTAGPENYIEVDDAKGRYEVVVDGHLIAKDFTTVYPGPKPGTVIAYSAKSQPLDWPAPDGWKDALVQAVTLSDTGPSLLVEARVENGRLRLPLSAHRAVRVGPPTV